MTPSPQQPTPSVIGRRVAGAVLLAAVVGLAGSSTGCMPPGGIVIRPAPADLTLVETVLSRDAGFFVRDKVLLIDAEGAIASGAAGGLFGGGEDPVAAFIEKCEAAGDDPDVKAVVLRIDSPGGTVTGSELMHRAVQRLKARKQKSLGRDLPVVAQMMGVAASGGYYLAMSADEIRALPGTITGSIGVIMLMPDVSQLLRTLGVEVKALKSGGMKDAGSPFRPLAPDEQKYLQEQVVGRYYQQFLDTVIANRKAAGKMTAEQVKAVADGRILLGDAAAEVGLIDKVGTLEAAVDRAAEMAGLQRKVVVTYGRPLAWKSTLYSRGSVPAVGAAPAGGTTINLLQLRLDGAAALTQPAFLYYWSPGM